jgi:DNA-binding PadR family transcriptional regulator
LTKRTEVLELAVLGLLHDAPMHGYELRKRLTALLGWGRSLSYGSLYPALKDLVARGYIAESDADLGAGRARRGRIVYELTADGKEHFAELLSHSGPSSWEDEPFGVHFAFFSRTDAQTRMRILEGRRSRLEERLATFRTSLQRTREKLDTYTLELQRHGLESVEREVRWLDELIDHERHAADPQSTTAGTPGTRK